MGGKCRLGTKDATSFDEKDIVIVGVQAAVAMQ